jgi:hypothetical protein
MAITGQGWELLVTREREETRNGRGFSRAVARYQVFHNGHAMGQLKGQLVERGGPGDNSGEGDRHDRRIEAKSYPLSTHDGASNEKYKTIGYSPSGRINAASVSCKPKIRRWPSGPN